MRRITVCLIALLLLFSTAMICYGTEATSPAESQPEETEAIEETEAMKETAPPRNFRTEPSSPSQEIKRIRTERVILIVILCLLLIGVIIVAFLWQEERGQRYDIRYHNWQMRNKLYQEAPEPKYISLWSMFSLVAQALIILGALLLPIFMENGSQYGIEDAFERLLLYVTFLPMLFLLSAIAAIVGIYRSRRSVFSKVVLILNAWPLLLTVFHKVILFIMS